MLKALHIVGALLAATTLWGQPEPVSVTVGQTARLTVTARPPDTCAAQIGFLDNSGKPIGPSSHVSLQPGQSTTLDLPSNAVVKERVVIQARIVADQGIAASACQADVEVSEAKPSGGPREGIKVHGHWTIDVRNPDGTPASHRDFENSLEPAGAAGLVGSLSRASVTGLWLVALEGSGGSSPCNNPSTGFCLMAEPTEAPGPFDSRNLAVSVPTTGPNSGKIVLNGSLTASASGAIALVSTELDVCAVGVLPANCNLNNVLPSTAFTVFTAFIFAANNQPSVPVVAGQLVQVTVVISFS
jgi:hypothetical protein